MSEYQTKLNSGGLRVCIVFCTVRGYSPPEAVAHCAILFVAHNHWLEVVTRDIDRNIQLNPLHTSWSHTFGQTWVNVCQEY